MKKKKVKVIPITQTSVLKTIRKVMPRPSQVIGDKKGRKRFGDDEVTMLDGI